MSENRLIFITGTGRSGTHLIGRAISSHPEIDGRIEDPKTFGLITRLGTSQDIRGPLHNGLLRVWLRFKLRAILKNSKHHVLEKSHPSLWLMEWLMKVIPGSKFIGVWRELEPTVSSMLIHKGVLTWYDRLPQDKPNRFLGITEQNKNSFQNLSIEEKCALRWLSHKQELERLLALYPDRMVILKYEDFLNDPDKHLGQVASFVGVKDSFDPEPFKLESLDKWKDHLSQDQVERIRILTRS